jgi:hypothetical protein
MAINRKNILGRRRGKQGFRNKNLLACSRDREANLAGGTKQGETAANTVRKKLWSLEVLQGFDLP